MSTKKQTYFNRAPQSFGASGLFPVNPALRPAPKPLPCRRCFERPTAYRFCDWTGHNVQPAGLCKKCMSDQTATDEEIMDVEIETFNILHPNRFNSVPLVEIERMVSEADAAHSQENQQWLADWELLAELRLARTFIAQGVGNLQEMKARVRFIEEEYPFLEDALLGLTDTTPHPFNAPFCA